MESEKPEFLKKLMYKHGLAWLFSHSILIQQSKLKLASDVTINQ